MKKMVDGILRQYGSSILLQHGDETVIVRGFFQPVRSKSWQSVVNITSTLGEFSRGQYVYMGPADVPVAVGDCLEIGGEQYLFRRTEPYYYGDQAVYIWGLCVEKGVNDTWGSRS
mgnify:CR=1 FL=1